MKKEIRTGIIVNNDSSAVFNITIVFTIIMLALCAWLFSGIAQAETIDDPEGLSEADKAWLNSDEPIQSPSTTVSEGKLRWLSFPADLNKYHLVHEIKLSKQSLETGWVQFEQCHLQLDSISKIDLVYPDGITKNIKVTKYSFMRQPEVIGNRVLMQQVKKGGSVCVSGISNAMRKKVSGWVVNRGPYMRRFLDGYYPMHVSETLDWSGTELKLLASNPESLSGKKLTQTHNKLIANYHFEGKLLTEYYFDSMLKK